MHYFVLAADTTHHSHHSVQRIVASCLLSLAEVIKCFIFFAVKAVLLKTEFAKVV